MNVNVIQYILLFALIATILYILYEYQKFSKLKREKEQTLGGKRKSQNYSKLLNKYAQGIYNILLRIPLVKTGLLQIRKKLETLSVYDEYSLRREVVKIIAVIIGFFTVGCLILLIIQPSWLIVFWILLGLLMLSGAFVEFFVYRVEAKLLVQLKNFINRVNFNYQQTKMIDEAIFDGIQYAGPEMKVHAERIYNIINSLEPEKELSQYEEVAPTRYLRVLAGLTLLVKERGDHFSEKGSSFINGITAINKELNDEILYRSRLTFALRSLSTLALIPIFFALPVKNWSTLNFPTTEQFYSSRIGFLSEIAVYAISVGCYLIIRKMKQINEASATEIRSSRIKWEKWLLDKIPFLDKISTAFTPRNTSKRYREQQQLIKEANESFTVKELTVQRIVWSLLVFVALVSSFTFAHYREEQSVLNQKAVSSMFTSTISDKELKQHNQLMEYDKKLIMDLKEVDVLPSADELKSMIADQLGLDLNDPQVEKSYERIVAKWSIVSTSFLQWWEVFLAILFAWATTYIPIFILMFKRRERLKQMEKEVYQLLVIIAILRDFEGMGVFIILNWLQRFSIAFKGSITIAIEEFDSGGEEALEKLAEANTFEPFQQIVERLKLSLVKLSIKEAFQSIEMEREFYLEQRRDEQRQSIESKSRLGNFLGLAPLAALIFIYLIFPIMYLAIKESGQIMDMLSI